MTAAEQPRPMLRGEKVYLRPAERTDIPTFTRWLNDVETASYLSTRSPLSLAMEERWFDQMLESHGKDAYHFVISTIDDDRPIGTIGLFDVNHVSGNAGIGISIGERALWGKGLGTDALNALLDFGFGELRLERMWLDVYDFNTRGRRSYEKAGFVLEGTKRRASYRRGRFVDVHLMSILRDEWMALDRRRTWEYETPAG